MKFYLSASFERRDEMRQYREQIRAAGHECRCRWLDEQDPEFERRVEILDVNPCIIAASVDWDDIREADAFIAFTGGGKRGGRHVELGIAMAEQKIVRIVGEPEHIFHATLRRYATFAEAFTDVLEVCDA